MFRFVIIGSLLLCASFAQADDCDNWFQQLFSKAAPLEADAPSLSSVDTFNALATKNALLEQDAAYLSSKHCGGTCVSVSMINNMLVMVERMQPGAITKLSKGQIIALHKKLIKLFLQQLKILNGKDGTKGASLAEFDQVYKNVIKKVFPKIPTGNLSVDAMGPFAFQSVMPDSNSLMVIAVNTEKDSHAIVVTGIKRLPQKSTAADPIPEDFIITISDPHEPGTFKDLNVYQTGNSLFLEGYGGPNAKVPVESYGKTFYVKAGRITTSTNINFGKFAAVKSWTHDELVKFPPRVDIYLKNGTILHDVDIQHGNGKNTVIIFYTFMEREPILIESIADVRPIAR